jgi:hypothetical protein
MANVYGDSRVAKWQAEFRRGRESIGDDVRPGHPVQMVTDEVCGVVETLVMNDRRIKTREIAESVGISKGSVKTILHEKLGLSK